MRNPKTRSDSVPVLARLRLSGWPVAILLAVITIVLYWPATQCDFVNYDDNVFITENPHVQNGLTWEGIKWAFTNTKQAAYWAPMMWLSHMLACQLFGLNPWGHHLINILLHAANTALVFLLLRNLTGALWRSVMVAALFGWHPLHVESVAWVTERKDVLSAFFGLLSLICYVKAVTSGQPSPGFGSAGKGQVTRANSVQLPVTSYQSRFYWLSLLFFAFGLMSKAMLVTWPLVMLLLDYWPLQRVSSFKFSVSSAGTASPSTLNPLARRSEAKTAQLSTLVLEKLPFFGLAAAASVVTYVAQKHGGAVMSMTTLSLSARIGNALISYCRYLGKLFWPVDLAVFYPHPGYWPATQVLLAGGLLLSITTGCILVRRRCPFLLMGWLWFIGTLVPVIQLVQSGEQAMADRFSYVPLLGMLIFVIWGMYELTRQWRHRITVLSVAGLAVTVLCFGATRQQLGYWKNSEALFRHALAVTENNYLAHKALGVVLGVDGRTDEAIGQFQEAIRLAPDFAEARVGLGIAFDRKGRTDEAIQQFREAIRLKPDSADAYNDLGTVLYQSGQIAEAINQYQEAIRLEPDFAEAHYNLGAALGRKYQIDEAIVQFQEALRSET